MSEQEYKSWRIKEAPSSLYWGFDWLNDGRQIDGTILGTEAVLHKYCCLRLITDNGSCISFVARIEWKHRSPKPKKETVRFPPLILVTWHYHVYNYMFGSQYRRFWPIFSGNFHDVFHSSQETPDDFFHALPWTDGPAQGNISVVGVRLGRHRSTSWPQIGRHLHIRIWGLCGPHTRPLSCSMGTDFRHPVSHHFYSSRSGVVCCGNHLVIHATKQQRGWFLLLGPQGRLRWYRTLPARRKSSVWSLHRSFKAANWRFVSEKWLPRLGVSQNMSVCAPNLTWWSTAQQNINALLCVSSFICFWNKFIWHCGAVLPTPL